MKRAFTLVELMAVATIILLISSLAAPAIRSLLLSYQQTRAIGTFSSSLTTIQATARTQFTTAAMRVERAFEVDDQGRMIKDIAGNPQWLAHQHIRLLVFGTRREGFEIPGEELSFRQLADTSPIALPTLVWLAPGYALSPAFEVGAFRQPRDPESVPINTLDTFHIAFNRRGELIRLPPDKIVYLDETQGNVFLNQPHPSARAAIAYDRQAFAQHDSDLDYLKTGLPLYVDRYTGAAIPGRR